jgi:hypothetical protein
MIGRTFVLVVAVSGLYAIGSGTASAQTVTFGQTTLSLGVNADDAVRRLSKEFVLRPNHGRYQTWLIESVQVAAGDTTYRVDGQLVGRDGRITSLMKVISPDRPTSVSVAETFFTMLERTAGDGASCRVSVKRTGLESGPGAGGTMLTASIKCGAYEGTLTQVQGSDRTVSHEVTIAYKVSST